MQVFGERVRFGVEIVPTEARGIGIQIWGLRPEPAAIVAAEVRRFDAARFVQQRLMVAVQIALRMVVEFADGGGVVARLA